MIYVQAISFPAFKTTYHNIVGLKNELLDNYVEAISVNDTV